MLKEIQIPANWPGFLLLRFENICSPPLQPKYTGRSGHFELFSVGNAGLGEPVAADNHLAVLPYRGQFGERKFLYVKLII